MVGVAVMDEKLKCLHKEVKCYRRAVRSYDQYCPAAMALDLVGDRWTLLIVRELGIRPARYGDLHRALPGIATNLLAERLRTLTAAGVVRTDVTPDRTTYHLTEWGEELFDIVARLGRWGSRLLLAGQGERQFQPHYLVALLHAVYGLDDTDLHGLEPVSVRVDGETESIRIEVGDGRFEAAVDDARAPADVVLDGEPGALIAVLAGVAKAGTEAAGSRSAIRRLRSFTARSPFAVGAT